MTINSLNENAENLLSLDSDKFDLRITMNEYEEVKNNSEMLKKLSGKKSFNSWTDFKDGFISYQKDEYSFVWKGSKGQGGPLRLDKVILDAEVGYQLAELAMEEKIEKGNLRDALIKEKYLASLYRYLGEYFLQIVDLSDIREGYKTFTKDDKVYRYNVGRNNFEFRLYTSQYTYLKGTNRKREEAFGNLIKQGLKDAFELEYIAHTQLGREGKKYENDDLRGYRINRNITEDSISMYNFELKPDNRIESIYHAISQAVNYKARANYTYVVLPNVSDLSFHDTERLVSIRLMCEENQIGLISIEMKEDKVEQIVIVTEAVKTNLDDEKNLVEMLLKNGKAFCPLCRRFVDENRTTCGLADKDGNCLRSKIEELKNEEKSEEG